MAVSHLAFTMYPVTDLHRAVTFYEGDLGLKKSDVAGDAWVESDIAGATFGVGNFPQVGKPGSAQSLALEIAGLDAYRATLAGRGVESSEPHDLPSCRISVVQDPDGNHIWLHEAKAR